MRDDEAGMRAVVTGAAGFIGSALSRELLGQGWQVTGVDNERSGRWDRVDPRVRRIDASMCDLTVTEWQELLDGVDVVFHLAAEKYNSSRSTPQAVIDTNISATWRLFEAAGKTGVRRVVFTSSLYAYGQTGPAAMSELDLPVPTTVYGMSKVAGEQLLQVAAKEWGLSWNVARLFFVYGPDQWAEGGYKSVIMRNFERIRNAEPPVIFGDGKQSLDYVYLADVVAALITLARTPVEGVVINIGSGRAISVAELTDLMLEVSGSPLIPGYGPADWTDGTVRYGETERAKSILDWQAATPIRDGLKQVWDWMTTTREK